MEWTAGGDVPEDARTPIEDIDGGAPWDNGFINTAGLSFGFQPFAFDFVEGRITWRGAGLFHAMLNVQWADSFPDDSTVFTILEFFGNCPIGSNCGDYITTGYISNNQDWQQQWYTSSALWLVSLDDEDDAWVAGSVGQISDGADKFLSGAALTIVQLADFDPDAGEFFISAT
jgi:hypothetical protein